MMANMATGSRMSKFKGKFKNFEAIKFNYTVGVQPGDHPQQLLFFEMDANTAAMYKITRLQKIICQTLIQLFC